jgi:hypothetical protein
MRLRYLLAFIVVTGSIAAVEKGASAQQQTWNGMISDSQCGGDHGSEVDVRECTVKCISEGYKYILATENGLHTVPIANQDFAGLSQHAGDTVKVTGELRNGAIVISRIETP